MQLPKFKFLDERIAIHESLPVGVMLAMAGGFLDAYTYLFHGEVFASMQSGNVILLGLNLAQGNFDHIIRYVFPICIFLLGIFFTDVLKFRFEHERFVWQNVTVAIEAVGIFCVGIFSDSGHNLLINSSLSFFAAIQFATYRRLAGLPYATTMTTGNLRSIADYTYQHFFKKDPTASFKIKYTATIIFAFCLGATLSTLSAHLFAGKAIWLVSLLLFGVLGITIYHQK
ncbi:YoaK family protein [Enterococcus canintestini]|uniref:YoaK family protein n=1 Tax=Enterococcus canintestini TaxID=317010 RepID=UPI00288E8C62|nr:YoaK family protein [Enterococcus canintestini]MDT2739736.1 YoaK family protein [Enterococcus canintestini]